MPYIILFVYLAIALALQLLMGDFPVAFFSFPLNLLIALLWLIGMSCIWMNRRKSLFVTFMLSKGATISAVMLFLAFCLVIGITGMRSLVNTWVFAAFMLYFQTVLLYVILRGWREKTATGARLGRIRWRFLLNHVGLLVAVSAAFWGAPDSRTTRLLCYKDVPVREAARMDGTTEWLPYAVELKDFRVDKYENGVPAMYEADVLVDGVPATLKVNHPFSKRIGQDIYLSGYDSVTVEDPGYCIIQVVNEPWKYGAVAGITMMLAGAMMMFLAGPKKRYGEED